MDPMIKTDSARGADSWFGLAEKTSRVLNPGLLPQE